MEIASWSTVRRFPWVRPSPAASSVPPGSLPPSLKDDLIKQTYTRVYKKYVARRRAQAITDAQFAAWSAEAKKLRTQAYKTGMHEEAFRLQLDELMENIKGE